MSPDQTASQTPVVLDKFPDMALPALYRAAIGAINTTYYLKRFTRFEAGGRVGLSWNWAASLSTVNWLLFRKMALPLIAYLVTVVMLLILVSGTGQLILHWTPTVEWTAWTVVAAILFGFPGFMGNGWFYRQCRRDIEHAIQVSPTLEEACQALSAQASSRTRLVRIALANVSLLAIGIVLAFTLVNQASETENKEDSAPALLRRPASAVEPASAGVVQEPLPVAPISTLVPPVAMASAPPIAPPAAALSGLSINVGLFADPDNARRAYVKIVKAGLPASREVIVVHQQKVTRVRSGPYASRKEALAATTRIKALQLDAVLAKR